MNDTTKNTADKGGPGPKIDPKTEPLKASELASDEGAADQDAWHGARDTKKVQEGHTKPSGIDIERGDTDKPGDSPDEVPAAVPDQEILPPD